MTNSQRLSFIDALDSESSYGSGEQAVGKWYISRPLIPESLEYEFSVAVEISQRLTRSKKRETGRKTCLRFGEVGFIQVLRVVRP